MDGPLSRANLIKMAVFKCRDLAITLIFIALLVIFNSRISQRQYNYGFKLIRKEPFSNIESESIVKRNRTLEKLNDKWIVITTVAYATNAIVAMAAESDWRVVVVANSKTPTDWNHTNCDFLSIEKQKELAYEINTLVPLSGCTRKMIGYLYAIQNGAEWIYDTDDGSQLIGKKLRQTRLIFRAYLTD